jgi:hypothetical protein
LTYTSSTKRRGFPSAAQAFLFAIATPPNDAGSACDLLLEAIRIAGGCPEGEYVERSIAAKVQTNVLERVHERLRQACPDSLNLVDEIMAEIWGIAAARSPVLH